MFSVAWNMGICIAGLLFGILLNAFVRVCKRELYDFSLRYTVKIMFHVMKVVIKFIFDLNKILFISENYNKKKVTIVG